MLDKYNMWVKYSWLGGRSARANLNLFAVCKVEFKCSWLAPYTLLTLVLKSDLSNCTPYSIFHHQSQKTRDIYTSHREWTGNAHIKFTRATLPHKDEEVNRFASSTHNNMLRKKHIGSCIWLRPLETAEI
jgi:hypothetical protein